MVNRILLKSLLITFFSLSTHLLLGQAGVVTKIYTDFGGYWYSGGSFAQVPNNSHNLLAYVYDGVTYSTGVNDALLNAKGVTYTPSNFYALPAILNGAPGNVISVGCMLDESYYTMGYTHPNIKDITSENVLMDGIHGLNIGTGYTNLPAATTALFNIQTIITSKINDNEPDIIVAQIAGPGGTADVFKFIDASGNTVGNSVNVIFNTAAKAPLLSYYGQDQFPVLNTSTQTASTSKPYTSTGWNSNNAGGSGNGQIRMVAFKLSEFGITASNYTQIKSFTTLPSGTTDLAFVGYSHGAINVPPSLGINTTTTNSVICTNGGSSNNAFLSVRPYASSGGDLSFYWEVSTDAGTNWTRISDNSTYSGSSTINLSITGATVGYQYRATVTESGTGYSSTSSTFTITAVAGGAITGTVNPTGFTSCVFATTGTTSLSVSPTGGTGTYSYQWSSSSSSGGTYTNIPDATSSTYNPNLSASGNTYYKVTINSGCYSNTSTAALVTVTGGYISSFTNGQKCTTTGAVTISATATAGTVNWYTASSGGTAVASGNSYAPSPTATTTYYAAAVSGTCESARVAVVASVFTTSMALTITATSTCLNSGSSVSIYNSSITNGTYTLNYSFSGTQSASNGSASVTFINGAGSFTTNAFTATGTTTMTISGILTSTGCTVTNFTGNTASITISNSNPSVSNFSLSATSACTNIQSLATITSSTLASGTYLVTYNISGTNTLETTTSQMVFTAGSPGTGSFYLPLLPTQGTNNVLQVTNIALLSAAYCGSALNATYTFANNTTPILNAGSSFTACAIAGTNILISGSASASDYSALAWSSSNGTGTFSNNTTALALTGTSYAPSAADMTRGSAYLTLTATANPGCTDVIKTITLTLTANAVGGSVSSNQTITYNTQPATITLSGHTGSISSWQKSTDPSFTSPTTLAYTTTTLTGANIGNLIATTYFRAVLTNGTCTAYSSYITISISGSPTVSSFTPTIATTGETVTITGTNFTNATAVSFGGTAASSYSVVNATTITAVVNTGSSGSISVTNASGAGSLTGFTYCTTTTPSISIAADATTICSGTTIRFTATITNGGSSPTYQWKKNGTNVGISSSLYSDATIQNGDIVSCVLTSSANCTTSPTATSNSITITVGSNSAASVSIAASNSTICSGSNITFTATPTNPGTTLSYQWKKNGVNVGTDSTNYSSSTWSNSDYVICELSSSSACVAASTATSNQITISVYAAPSAAVISGTTTITSGSSAQLQIAITGGSSPYSITYSNGTTPTTINNYTSGSNISVTPTVTTYYTIVSVIDANGCSGTGNTGTATITVNSSSSSTATLSGTTTACSGSTSNIQVNITGSTGPFTVIYSNGTNNVTVNNYSSDANIAVSPTTTTTFSLVSVKDANNNNISSLSGTATITISPQWTGAVSDNWNNPSNWCSNAVPDGTGIIILSSGNPKINTDITISGSLTLSGTATLTINAGKTLSISSGGVVDFGGKLVTFKSDNSGTAQLGTVAGTLSNATNVVVERFIPASNRAFRFLSPAVTSTTSIRANWMEGATPDANMGYPFSTQSVYNPNPGYGTLITGLNGASNGFDPTQTNNPSLFTFNNSTQAWAAVTNTNGTLTAGTPYRMLIRGDRSYNVFANSEPPHTATNLRTLGTMVTGTLTSGIELPALSQAADGWSLVGNPYQAAVDMTNAGVVKTNLTGYYYIWDPKQATRGAYVAYNLSANASNNINSAMNRYLQPGQAFFVQNSAAGSNRIQFQETAKADASNQSGTHGKLVVSYPSLSAVLYYTDSLANGAPAMDATRVLFDASFNNAVDQQDGKKFTNLDETIAIRRGTNSLSMELRGLPDTNTVLPIHITQYRAQQYTLRLKWDQFLANNGLIAYVNDKYKNKTTAIKENDFTNIVYTIDTVAASAAADRFEIIFKNAPSVPTPVTNLAANEFIKLYPNPLKSFINLLFSLNTSLQVNVKIFDITGKLIMEKKNLKSGAKVQFDSIRTGTYFIQIANLKGSIIKTEKLIKH